MLNQNDKRIIKAIKLTIKLLSEIKGIDVDSDITKQIVSKVFAEVCNTPTYAPAQTDTVIECLQHYGGSASRAQIAAGTCIDPNAISSLLNKLVKKGIIKKILLTQDVATSGRGHKPEYIYTLVNNTIN